MIAGSVLYHTSSRSIDPRISPSAALVVAYALAFFIVSALTIGIDRQTPSQAVFVVRRAGWSAVGVGFGAVLIEIGYILAYRHGGRLSTASVTATALSSALLATIGTLWFGERFSPRIAIGIAAAAAAVLLLAH